MTKARVVRGDCRLEDGEWGEIRREWDEEERNNASLDAIKAVDMTDSGCVVIVGGGWGGGGYTRMGCRCAMRVVEGGDDGMGRGVRGRLVLLLLLL